MKVKRRLSRFIAATGIPLVLVVGAGRLRDLGRVGGPGRRLGSV